MRQSNCIKLTRMHSSRMRTAPSSSHLLGGGDCLSACWDTPTPWAWRSPPRCGPGDPSARPVNLSTGYRPGDPPSQNPQPPPRCRPLNIPPGVGLETPSPSQTLQPSPLVWAWRPPSQTPLPPLWMWVWSSPLSQTPQPPPGCGPGDPPHPWTDRHV